LLTNYEYKTEETELIHEGINKFVKSVEYFNVSKLEIRKNVKRTTYANPLEYSPSLHTIFLLS